MTRAAAVVAATLAACGATRAAPQLAVVVPGEVAPRVLMSGALHPLAAAEITVPDTRVSQLTVRWLVPTGTVVAAGDRVAELDSAPLAAPLQDERDALDTQALQLRVQRRNDAVTLAARHDDVRKAQIERDKAALHANLPAGVVDNKTAHDNALRLVHAEISVKAAEQDLASTTELVAARQQLAELDIESARRTITRTEDEIASLVLRAPRAGIAIVAPSYNDRPFQVGDTVSATMRLVTMPDLGVRVEVAARLADVDDGAVAPGMTGTCTLAAFPDRPIACTVETVAPVARPGAHRALLRRGFDVDLALADTDPTKLRAGMSFEVVMHRPSVRGLVVPRGALRFDGEAARVVLATHELRDVAVGACDAQQCTVDRGLVAGDVVFAAPDGGTS